MPPLSATHLCFCAISALALYRGVMFIHELTHLSKSDLPGFHEAWDLLFGIPLQLPSFLYLGVHLDHHRRTVYGTAGDPEYLPLAAGPRWRTGWFLGQAPFVPLALLLRFALMAPLSLLLGGRVRRLVVERASSLAINPRYRRDPHVPALKTRWIVCETLAAAVSLGVLAATLTGRLSPAVLIQWLCVSAAVAVVNQLRTLGAHRWRNDGREMDVPGQFLDSVNTPHPFGAVWAPVGLRFHALHHFLPDMPYHALGAAHRRLKRDLPPEAGYARVESPGLGASIAAVWRDAGRPSGAR